MRDENGRRIACKKCFHYNPIDPTTFDGTCRRVVQDIRLAKGDTVRVKDNWFCGYFEPVQYENLYKKTRRSEWTKEDEDAATKYRQSKSKVL